MNFQFAVVRNIPTGIITVKWSCIPGMLVWYLKKNLVMCRNPDRSAANQKFENFPSPFHSSGTFENDVEVSENVIVIDLIDSY